MYEYGLRSGVLGVVSTGSSLHTVLLCIILLSPRSCSWQYPQNEESARTSRILRGHKKYGTTMSDTQFEKNELDERKTSPLPICNPYDCNVERRTHQCETIAFHPLIILFKSVWIGRTSIRDASSGIGHRSNL